MIRGGKLLCIAMHCRMVGHVDHSRHVRLLFFACSESVANVRASVGTGAIAGGAHGLL